MLANMESNRTCMSSSPPHGVKYVPRLLMLSYIVVLGPEQKNGAACLSVAVLSLLRGDNLESCTA